MPIEAECIKAIEAGFQAIKFQLMNAEQFY